MTVLFYDYSVKVYNSEAKTEGTDVWNKYLDFLA